MSWRSPSNAEFTEDIADDRKAVGRMKLAMADIDDRVLMCRLMILEAEELISRVNRLLKTSNRLYQSRR